MCVRVRVQYIYILQYTGSRRWRGKLRANSGIAAEAKSERDVVSTKISMLSCAALAPASAFVCVGCFVCVYVCVCVRARVLKGAAAVLRLTGPCLCLCVCVFGGGRLFVCDACACLGECVCMYVCMYVCAHEFYMHE